LPLPLLLILFVILSEARSAESKNLRLPVLLFVIPEGNLLLPFYVVLPPPIFP